jgi:multidrug efflux pump subunit AcrA (membrane-fusion protein)
MGSAQDTRIAISPVVQELPMMKQLVIVGVAAVLGFGGYTYYTTTQRLPVKTVPVTHGNVLVTVSTVFTGSITSEREATLSFQTAGQLVYVGVQEGGTLSAGGVVGRPDDVEARAQLLLAESNLRAAQVQLQRARLSVPLEDAMARAKP